MLKERYFSDIRSLGFVPLYAARGVLQNCDRIKWYNLIEIGFTELLLYPRIKWPTGKWEFYVWEMPRFLFYNCFKKRERNTQELIKINVYAE